MNFKNLYDYDQQSYRNTNNKINIVSNQVFLKIYRIYLCILGYRFLLLTFIRLLLLFCLPFTFIFSNRP